MGICWVRCFKYFFIWLGMPWFRHYILLKPESDISINKKQTVYNLTRTQVRFRRWVSKKQMPPSIETELVILRYIKGFTDHTYPDFLPDLTHCNYKLGGETWFGPWFIYNFVRVIVLSFQNNVICFPPKWVRFQLHIVVCLDSILILFSCWTVEV